MRNVFRKGRRRLSAVSPACVRCLTAPPPPPMPPVRGFDCFPHVCWSLSIRADGRPWRPHGQFHWEREVEPRPAWWASLALNREPLWQLEMAAKTSWFQSADSHFYLGRADSVSLIRLRTNHGGMKAFEWSEGQLPLQLGSHEWSPPAPIFPAWCSQARKTTKGHLSVGHAQLASMTRKKGSLSCCQRTGQLRCQLVMGPVKYCTPHSHCQRYLSPSNCQWTAQLPCHIVIRLLSSTVILSLDCSAPLSYCH